MNSNRPRGVNNYNRANNNNNNNNGTTYNNNRRFTNNNNNNNNNPPRHNANVHTVASPPTRNAWGVNSINASVTGIASLSGRPSASSSAPPSVSTTPIPKTNQQQNQQHAPSPQAELDAQRHMHDRVVYLLAKSIGLHVIATVASGARYRGILIAASADAEIGIVLAFPEKFAEAPGDEDADDASQLADIEKMAFLPKDLVDIEIESPDLSVDRTTNGAQGSAYGSKFKTDTDISGAEKVLKERDLQRWEDDNPSASIGLSLEDDPSNQQPWDQFAANEKKFGVQSTYNENYYTTTINRDTPGFKELERKAAQIASEIENSSYGGNVHIAEERGLTVDDSGMDEEDKYSGVQRQQQTFVPQAKTNNNKYTPPQYRKQKAANIPYDPAIVTSQLAGKGPATAVTTTPAKSPALDHHLHTPVSHSGGTSTPISALFGSSDATKSGAGTPAPASTSTSTPANSTAATPKPEPKSGPSTPSTKTPLPPSVALSASSRKLLDKEKPAATSNVGDVTKDLAGNFKQFVDTEVEKVQQKKQYLQNKEKSDRINEFKTFSENYKINTPVPVDLAPILGKKHTEKKNETKPETLTAAIDEAHAKKQVPEVPSPLAPTSKPTPSAPAATTKQQRAPASPPKHVKPSPAGPTPKLNLNFKAPEFRPNPAAHSFMPSFSSSPGTNHASTSAYSSPFVSHPSPAGHNNNNHHQRSRNNNNPFFGNKTPNAKPIGDKFNLFVRIYDEHVNEKENSAPLVIEKSYVTLPTWSVAAERSYTELVPSQEALSAGANGTVALGGPGLVPVGGIPVGGLAAMGGLGGFGGIGGIAGAPFAYNRSPVMPGGTLPPNLGGPGMIPVLQDPRAMMPSSPPNYSQVGFMGYPQYPGAPQYSAGGPGPQFYGRPPQPFPIPNMMGGHHHQPGAAYMGGFQDYHHHPQGPPGHHHHQSPRGPHVAPVPQGQFSGNNGGNSSSNGGSGGASSGGASNGAYFSPQQQHQYLRSPGPNNGHGHGHNRHRQNNNQNDH